MFHKKPTANSEWRIAHGEKFECVRTDYCASVKRKAIPPFVLEVLY